MPLEGHPVGCRCEPCLQLLPRKVTGFAVTPEFLIRYYKTRVSESKDPNQKITDIRCATALAMTDIKQKTRLPLLIQLKWEDRKYILRACEENPFYEDGGYATRTIHEQDPQWVQGIQSLRQLLVDEGAIGPDEEMEDYEVYEADMEKRIRIRRRLWRKLDFDEGLCSRPPVEASVDEDSDIPEF
ncbi:hypothetical protein SISNIDRAFT_489205 [Sistotremastrum niveocremeum HHB9708]|uniref:Uncharacterized protein n=1 Tax=Sistotremastrum niveocremeum HHB9708 TaxID=1314777 RepID=A0A164QBV4_9AGAM|nr:hypothetical protein SISNIDRAFT_489205 [Sistotremastrum niveocremeum HHB9708]